MLRTDFSSDVMIGDSLADRPVALSVKEGTIFVDQGGDKYVAIKGQWVNLSTSSSGLVTRGILTGDFYVNTATGNDSNNGTSAATPWRTLAPMFALTEKADAVDYVHVRIVGVPSFPNTGGVFAKEWRIPPRAYSNSIGFLLEGIGLTTTGPYTPTLITTTPLTQIGSNLTTLSWTGGASPGVTGAVKGLWIRVTTGAAAGQVAQIDQNYFTAINVNSQVVVIGTLSGMAPGDQFVIDDPSSGIDNADGLRSIFTGQLEGALLHLVSLKLTTSGGGFWEINEIAATATRVHVDLFNALGNVRLQMLNTQFASGGPLFTGLTFLPVAPTDLTDLPALPFYAGIFVENGDLSGSITIDLGYYSILGVASNANLSPSGYADVVCNPFSAHAPAAIPGAMIEVDDESGGRTMLTGYLLLRPNGSDACVKVESGACVHLFGVFGFADYGTATAMFQFTKTRANYVAGIVGNPVTDVIFHMMDQADVGVPDLAAQTATGPNGLVRYDSGALVSLVNVQGGLSANVSDFGAASPRFCSVTPY